MVAQYIHIIFIFFQDFQCSFVILSSFRPDDFALGIYPVTCNCVINKFLVERISFHLNDLSIETFVPEAELVNYKEALIMGLLGILRWREQPTVLASVTGAQKDSIGGALWLGSDA